MLKSSIHRGISELFVPYLNGHASRKEIRALEDHLAECAECQEQIGIVALIATRGRPSWLQRNEPDVNALSVGSFRK